MVTMQNFNLTMKNNIFDGTEPIRVLYFVSRFVQRADMLNMSDAHACIDLPRFLVETAERYSVPNLAERHAAVALHAVWKPSNISFYCTRRPQPSVDFFRIFVNFSRRKQNSKKSTTTD